MRGCVIRRPFCPCGAPGRNVLALGAARTLDTPMCATRLEFAGHGCRKAITLVAVAPLLDEEGEQEPDDRGAGEQGVDAVEDAAMTGEQGAHVLEGQVALDH
jgi:hypothetical protein